MTTRSETKEDIIEKFKHKVRNASPTVKKVTFRGLEYKTKSQLKRMLSRAKVTSNGDIRYT